MGFGQSLSRINCMSLDLEDGQTKAVGGDENSGYTDTLPPPVRRARRLLEEHYVRAKDKFDAGMLPDGAAPTVEHVQVNLLMLPKRSLQQEFRPGQEFAPSFDMWRVEHVFSQAGEMMKPVTLESLFENPAEHEVAACRDGSDTVCVIAVARAGCGKTFVLTKIAPMQWALGALWPHMVLVVVRELRYRDVRGATTLGKLLGLDGIGIEDADEQRVICDYVRAHPDCLCLVLDGLDDTSMSDCSSFVQDVITAETLQGVHLIVTSRPNSDVFSLSTLSHFGRHVELVGFRRTDVETYIGKVLQVQKARALTAEVRRSEYLRGMMATPFMAKEICLLYHRDDYIPRCVADVFQQLIVQIMERTCGHKFKRWSHVPKVVRSQVLEIGKFAFSMLVEKRLIFTEEDIQECCLSENAISLGLLVTCEESLSKDTARQWRFSHLPVQEHLAAIHQAQHQPMTKARIVRLVERLGAESAHLRTFWVLLCAQLDANQADYLITSLLTRDKIQEWHGEMDELDFKTSDPFPFNFISPMCDVVDAAMMYQLAEEMLVKQFAGTGGKDYIEAKVAKEYSTPCDVAFLKTLLLAWQDQVPDASPDLLLQLFGNVSEKLQLHCRKSLAESSKRVSDQTAAQPKIVSRSRLMLAFQCFAEFVIHCRKMACHMPSVKAALQSNELFIDGHSHPSECRTIDTVLQHYPSAVRKVHVDKWCSLSPGQFPASLAQCSEIRYLRISECSADDACRIVRSVVSRSSSNLCALALSAACPVSFAAEVLCAVSSCQQLKHLHISASQGSSAGAGTDLVTALPGMRSLETFGLRGCTDMADSGIAEVCLALAGCGNLFKVMFHGCGLTEFSLTTIAAALQHWPQLTWLDLDSNDFRCVTSDTSDRFVAAVNANKSLTGCRMVPSVQHRSVPSEAYVRLTSQQSYNICKLIISDP